MSDGNIRYQALDVGIDRRKSSIEMCEEDEILNAPMTFETRTIFLQVEVLRTDGDAAEVKRFGETTHVPRAQLHETPWKGHNVYPTGPTSPYTSLEEIKSELEGVREDA